MRTPKYVYAYQFFSVLSMLIVSGVEIGLLGGFCLIQTAEDDEFLIRRARNFALRRNFSCSEEDEKRICRCISEKLPIKCNPISAIWMRFGM